MKKLLCTVVAVVFCLGFVAGGKAGVVYVKGDGSGPGDGSTWATAFTNIQQGINLAISGDQVWVAAGTYFERVTLKDGVQLYGGFAGNETDLSQRNWKTNASILDGTGILPSSSLITTAGAGDSTRVDGLVLRNGSSGRGAGISCIKASPVLVNNLITNCTGTTGGGIYCSNASPVVSNNVIVGNRAPYNGGGIYCEADSNPVVANNIFRGNAASGIGVGGLPPLPGGGAIFSTASSPQIINNLFESNVATNTFHSSQLLGGAIYSSGGAPNIINNTFIKNWTALVIFPPTAIPVDTGGALYCDSASALIANNLVAFNTSGMKFGPGVPQLRNNCTYGNSFFEYQGANPTGTNGNISVDPKLAGPYADVHLTADSPCRGAGNASLIQDNWLDIDGTARLTGAGVDIGADQYDGTSYSFPGRVIRVSMSGNDANDGSSWSKSLGSIDAAVARLREQGGEIWVAKGTYPGSIRVPTFVYLYGGFAGNETLRSQRDWTRNRSALDVRGFSKVSMFGFGENSSFSGFTLQNGTDGALYCLAAFSGNISNNRIIHNSNAFGNAAAIYVAGNAQIINNIIASNRASGSFQQINAVIYCDVGSRPLIANNTVIGNKNVGPYQATGGISVAGASPKIVNNIIAYNDGGNIVCASGSNVPVLMNNCVFGSDSNYVGVLPGMNDISVDPQVNDLSANFALKSSSPCIDAGDASVVQAGWQDIFGRTRIQGAAVDIGAYESSNAAEWLPLIYSPNVNVTTVGGVTYSQYSTVFTNDGFRVVSIGPVERAGTNFSQDFQLEWFTGATSPASNMVSGTSVLGVLSAGNYTFTTKSWGGAEVRSGFGVPTNATPTLTMVGPSPAGEFQMNVAGVEGVNYIVLTSTNLVDWDSVHTNHGGPFLFTDEVKTNEEKRFYRVQVVP